MPIKVGIPRALLFYEYYSLWISFFEELGAEVIVSEKTNKEIIDIGVKNTVDEACLPVKVFHGHVMDLKNRVDYIFIPRIISLTEGEYICPKFCGLPEMIKYSIKDIPKFIDTTINFRKSKKNLNRTVMEIGSYITQDKKKIKRAFEIATEKYNNHRMLMETGLLPNDMLKKDFLGEVPQPSKKDKVLLLGHPYNIYDSYMSMEVIDKLRKHGLRVVTCDNLETDVIDEKAKTLNKKMFWSFGRKILGTTLHAIEDDGVCGIIYMACFGCGLDSVIAEIVERKVRRSSDKPFAMLSLDEHTGEAGINTRIEAFVDMIRWREDHEDNLSTYR
ncbi:MAG: acyl-CoA dehydratase activase-related protein [Clostridia bacterium]|nr:acyl-CoA dehydratase activase-related protein [Clostridia bacterium]